MTEYQIHGFSVVLLLNKYLLCLLLLTSCGAWPIPQQNNNIEDDSNMFAPNMGLSLFSREELLNEPSCSQLKIMWRFSMKQSRIAEITNRYPMYRDPFAHNLWDDFDRPLSHVFNYNNRGQEHYVYGQIRHTLPVDAPPRSEDKLAFGKIRTSTKHKVSQATNRMVGKPSPPFSPKGQFQVLKEMIKEERHQQNSKPKSKSRKAQEVKGYRAGKMIAQTPTKLYQKPRSKISPNDKSDINLHDIRSKQAFYFRNLRNDLYYDDDSMYYDV